MWFSRRYPCQCDEISLSSKFPLQKKRLLNFVHCLAYYYAPRCSKSFAKTFISFWTNQHNRRTVLSSGAQRFLHLDAHVTITLRTRHVLVVQHYIDKYYLIYLFNHNVSWESLELSRLLSQRHGVIYSCHCFNMNSTNGLIMIWGSAQWYLVLQDCIGKDLRLYLLNKIYHGKENLHLKIGDVPW